MQISLARNGFRLLATVALLAACGSSDENEAASSDSAADTAVAAAAAATAEPSSPADNTVASLTTEDIDRWQKGLEGELEAVKKAQADLKAAKTGNDTLSAIMAANDMSTRSAGAKAAGVDEERYQLIRTTFSNVVGQMAPIEQEMDVSSLPAASVEELKKNRAAGVTQATAGMSAELVEALNSRAAALRKQDLALTAERLKAAGMAR